MKRLFFLLTFLFVATFAGLSQENNDFKTFANAEKVQMLKAYAKKDVASFRKSLDALLVRYNKENDQSRQWEQWQLEEEYYLLADLYALAGDKKNAIDYLIKSENYDYNDLTSDHDMDNIRKDPRFIKFLDSAKNKNSGILITLKKASEYNTGEKDKLPEFKYQSPDDPNLVALKTTYNLDSIAGKGNDVSQIINLMEWVHYLVPHDGSKGNPKTKNAMSLITECRRDHKTLNCRGLAIVLNEVYLAEGFKSRFITCLPKDTADNDCHVITMVWSKSLKKWLWMDPTFMAYVMDEKGQLLSIEEVRERLVTRQPLILNPDANRNHAASQTKEEYLEYYMTKNLYKLECPLYSQYNYETKEDGKTAAYMLLLPGNTHPATTSTKDKHGMDTYTLYYTNNPKTFWAEPAGVRPAVTVDMPNSAYEQVMEKFKNFYNARNVDSIDYMFDNPGEMKGWLNQKMLDGLIQDYGKMISYKYMARDDADDNNHDVGLFKMVFEKSVHAMGISIDKDYKLGTFRFQTSSLYIDKLLAKEL